MCPGDLARRASCPCSLRRFGVGLSRLLVPFVCWGNFAETEFGKGHIALLHAPGYLEDQQVIWC